MSESASTTQPSPSAAETAIRELYQRLLDQWNGRRAAEFAGLFTADANVIGFDGSAMDGRAAIESHLQEIFANHPTAAYVGKDREVRFLAPDVALLRSVVGMIPPGQADLNPAVNAVQTLVAVRQDGQWRIALYQNTPAAFHGRPDLSQALTEELRQLL